MAKEQGRKIEELSLTLSSLSPAREVIMLFDSDKGGDLLRKSTIGRLRRRVTLYDALLPAGLDPAECDVKQIEGALMCAEPIL